MYKITIKQFKTVELSNGDNYETSSDISIDVKSIEDIETIIGLFANDNTQIIIAKGGN
jgi:hypothetical protein